MEQSDEPIEEKKLSWLEKRAIKKQLKKMRKKLKRDDLGLVELQKTLSDLLEWYEVDDEEGNMLTQEQVNNLTDTEIRPILEDVVQDLMEMLKEDLPVGEGELIEPVEVNIQRFRKKPMEIEAVQWTGDNKEEIDKFVGVELAYASNEDGSDIRLDMLMIPTLESAHEASKGDWIIKGIKGEFYPCKPDIFEETYERVEDEDKL